MDVTVTNIDGTELETPLLALGIFEGESAGSDSVEALDHRLDGQISEVIRRGDFKGKEKQTLLLYSRGAVPAERILLVGLGARSTFDGERLRRASGTAVREAVRIELSELALDLPRQGSQAALQSSHAFGRAVAEGAVLATYAFEEFKTGREEEEQPTRSIERITLLEKDPDRTAEVQHGATEGAIVARAENFARNLGNLPGNVATPSYLAAAAERIGREHGQRVTVLEPAALESEGMGALLAVSHGSNEEPRLIIIEHLRGVPGEKPLVLVGKGLTFDAGGISIKPAGGMEEMKFDMCGGAAVLGAMKAIGELALDVNVIGVVPSSENLLGGSAMKPGDIIRSHLGKTIEVVNTDAEGRLILADALSYIRRFDPAAVVDAATLTGACVTALGHHASAVLGNDETLVGEIRAAGDRAGERVWPLPMLDEYREQIKSDYADIKNSGGRPAGAITAAWFLREFVGEFPWAHLDIAGTAYGDGKLPYQAKGSTGAPTRLFVEWVRSRAS